MTMLIHVINVFIPYDTKLIVDSFLDDFFLFSMWKKRKIQWKATLELVLMKLVIFYGTFFSLNVHIT